MTSKKKLRSLLGGTLFMVLMLSVHPTTVSASAVGSSMVMDQSVETEDQQSGIQSETRHRLHRTALLLCGPVRMAGLRQATAAGIFMRTDS